MPGKRMVWKAPEDDSYVNRGVSRRRALQIVFSGRRCFLCLSSISSEYDKHLFFFLLVKFIFWDIATRVHVLCFMVIVFYMITKFVLLNDMDRYFRESFCGCFLYNLSGAQLLTAYTWFSTFHIFQLLLDVLNFSAASYSALTRCLVSVDKESMDVSERFIMEQLNLTKDSISESKVLYDCAFIAILWPHQSFPLNYVL